jgi:hypothetical protein
MNDAAATTFLHFFSSKACAIQPVEATPPCSALDRGIIHVFRHARAAAIYPRIFSASRPDDASLRSASMFTFCSQA